MLRCLALFVKPLNYIKKATAREGEEESEREGEREGESAQGDDEMERGRE